MKPIQLKQIIADFILNIDETKFLNQPTSTEVVTPAESTIHPALVEEAKLTNITLTLEISLIRRRNYLAHLRFTPHIQKPLKYVTISKQH